MKPIYWVAFGPPADPMRFIDLAYPSLDEWRFLCGKRLQGLGEVSLSLRINPPADPFNAEIGWIRAVNAPKYARGWLYHKGLADVGPGIVLDGANALYLYFGTVLKIEIDDLTFWRPMEIPNDDSDWLGGDPPPENDPLASQTLPNVPETVAQINVYRLRADSKEASLVLTKRYDCCGVASREFYSFERRYHSAGDVSYRLELFFGDECEDTFLASKEIWSELLADMVSEES